MNEETSDDEGEGEGDDKVGKDEISKFKSMFASASDAAMNKKSSKNKAIQDINEIFTSAVKAGILPELRGDPIFQIGTTVHRYGENDCYLRHVLCIGTCTEIEGAVVKVCKNERELIKEWVALVSEVDPDIITGYNIFDFDMEFVYNRALEIGIERSVMRRLSRIPERSAVFREKVLSSSGLGDNFLKYLDIPGRVTIDLMKVVQRDHKLDSYSLANVAATFIRGNVKKLGEGGRSMQVESVAGVSEGTLVYVRKDEAESESYNVRVERIDRDGCVLHFADELAGGCVMPLVWGLAKDDVTVNEIFASVRGSADDRSRVARYCIMDCALCNFLIMKMEIVANNVGMSNVCLVPLSYIFMRGQGIKIFSLVSKQCLQDGFMIPTLRSPKEIPMDECGGGYEGAIVLTPSPGIYTQPIAVHDYGSLYPSSMISENISHDTIVLDPKYDNLEGVEYVDVTYDVTEGDNRYEKRCRYVQNSQGVLPRILQGLLKQRKETRKKITYKRVVLEGGEVVYCKRVDKEGRKIYDVDDNMIEGVSIVEVSDMYNDFEKAVLDGLQLAYKVTANSLYGQVGARTSQIYLKELAASTTATGRNLILKAKDYMERVFGGKVIYGDTDSIFSKYPNSMYSKERLDREDWIKETIDISVRFQEEFQSQLKFPHVLEYEKTGYPFIIFSKKRYVYNKYEFDPKKYKQSSMGIVLKRRDNANVVKNIYGGIIDNILLNGDIRQSSQDLKKMVSDFGSGGYEKGDLVVSKTLKATYKDPQRIAHKVLADRMKERDPGSAPAVNDRVPYIYIVNDKKGVLQGDRIESPEYIEEKGLKIDYLHYITNQIMKPCLQIFALPGVLEEIPGYRKPLVDWDVTYQRLLKDMNNDPVRAGTKLGMMREEEAKKLIFEDTIMMLEHKKKNQTMISKYFDCN